METSEEIKEILAAIKILESEFSFSRREIDRRISSPEMPGYISAGGGFRD